MKLNLYKSFYDERAKRWAPGVTAKVIDIDGFVKEAGSAQVKRNVTAYRNGDPDGKGKLPSVCFTGFVPEGSRRVDKQMTPTQLFIIDVDHMKRAPREVWEDLKKRIDKCRQADAIWKNLGLVHITPSGEGLRMVLRCVENFPTLVEHMKWLDELLQFNDFGKFDEPVHNIGRVSYVPLAEEILLLNKEVFEGDSAKGPITSTGTGTLTEPRISRISRMPKVSRAESENEVATSTETDEKPWRSEYTEETYRGTKLTTIIDKYIEVYGEPGKGEKHNFYNRMVRDFRHITDNNPLILHDLLPRFNFDDTLSQCQSICRTNNYGRIPREFFMFLVKNGFYGKGDEAGRASLRSGRKSPAYEAEQSSYEDESDEEDENGSGNEKSLVDSMPAPPPVIAELISIAPKDFVVPAINALLPILGTLTSYVRATDESNGKTISTSFMSVVYAPPSTGKSFVERYINMLLEKIYKRDELNDARDAVFAREDRKRSANDRGQALPQTSVRIMEAKNSEAEFLEKQRNNRGHHMFTYCPEIDQWKKGLRAAGGDKSDMVRMAWDNNLYGQHFKSTNTFKGKVRLFWNILLCGTEDQLISYFRNITNGLVSRCSFTYIENQKYKSQPPQWKAFTKKAMAVINAFIDRCDERTYCSPVNYEVEKAYEVADEDFDKEVPWKVEFKPFLNVNIDWLNPVAKKFNEQQARKALRDYDEARDVFRRRVVDRAKRFALILTQCYDKPMKAADKKLCAKWLEWWMNVDLECILKPFGTKYVEQIEANIKEDRPRYTLFDRLEETFTTSDVEKWSRVFHILSNPRQVIHEWKKAGLIEKIDKNKYQKFTKKSTKKSTSKTKRK